MPTQATTNRNILERVAMYNATRVSTGFMFLTGFHSRKLAVEISN